jgi:hypothetical protein
MPTISSTPPPSRLSISTRKSLAHRRPRNDRELWLWVKHFLGFHIPRRAICPEHTAPYQAISDAFFHRIRKAIWIASRSSGKTRSLSVLHFANSHFKPRCWTLHTSTIEFQALLCKRYVDGYHTIEEFTEIAEQRTIARTRQYFNGSTFEIVPGTMGGLSGPKPQVFAIDEVEFMKWENVQQSIGMAHSTPDIPSLMLFGSTRQRTYGSLNRMSQNAERMGLAVYHFCVWESMAPCRVRARTCPLWERCEHGRWCNNEDGFLDPEDVISKAGLADEEVWDTQYASKRPSSKGLVYDTFDPAMHVKASRTEYVQGLPVYLAADWGYSHPACVLFAQKIGEVVSVFDEVYVQRKLNSQVLELVQAKLRQLGLPQVPQGWGDSEDPDAQTQFRQGLPHTRWNNGQIELEPRLRATRQRLKNALGETTIFFHPRCVNVIAEFSLYHCKEVGMGTDGEPLYSEEPEDESNHAMDALGYLCCGLANSGRPTMQDVLNLTQRDREALGIRGRPQFAVDRPSRERQF